MRKTGRCPKCDNDEIIEIGALYDPNPESADPAPLAAAVFFSKNAGPQRTVGKLTLSICSACGFSEIYTENPRKILDQVRGVKVTRGGATSPYRS
jgi:predicted nucleic-acid-binding Zn-ribbon protein